MPTPAPTPQPPDALRNDSSFVVYQASKVGEAYWWYQARQDLVRRLVKRFAPGFLKQPTLHSLDIGCGAGGTVNLLGTWGEAWGVDPDAGALALAQARGIPAERLVQASMASLTPFASNRFDLITCLDVLEHAPDPVPALAEVFRVLTPGGMALFTVPADPRLWSDRDLRLHHRVRYTPAQLRAELSAAGFEILRVTHTHFFYYWPFRLWLRWLHVSQVQAVPHVRQDTFETNPFFSWLWRGLLRLETEWWLRLPLPWGVSAVAIVRKPR